MKYQDIEHCVIIFIIDASESMRGAKIRTVNSAIEEVITELKDIAEASCDVDLELNILKISDSARWLYNDICKIDSFKWHEIHASGDRNVGMALKELDHQLRYGRFFTYNKKYLRPIVFLLTDGSSDDDYTESLNLLENNMFFIKAKRVGVAIGIDADREFLTDFTGNEEQVITVLTPEVLKKWIQFEELEDK